MINSYWSFRAQPKYLLLEALLIVSKIILGGLIAVYPYHKCALYGCLNSSLNTHFENKIILLHAMGLLYGLKFSHNA